MNRNYFIVLVILLTLSPLSGQEWTIDRIAQYETFDELEHILEYDNDTTYLINFWATWCGPCVKELPYIEALNKKYKDQAYKTILVSLDMRKQLGNKLVPFLNKEQICSEVVVLLDGKAHRWIDRVDPSWSGAIPITIVYKGQQREFHETEFHTTAELEEIVNRFIKKSTNE